MEEKKESESENKNKKREEVKRPRRKWVWLILVVLLLFFLGGVLKKTAIGTYFSLFKTFVFSSPADFRSDEERVNFLILGKGGAGHEAPDLTDTIIFASLDFASKNGQPSLTMISLPRDIWVESLRAKLNSVYYWGNQKEKNGGLALAESVVREILGQPIHYGVVIDFTVFKDLVNLVGGVNVQVERGFVDQWYPIAGKENDLCGGDPLYRCRYKTVVFEAGEQRMDGERALEFVRSRKAEGEEGTDLARAERQQLVVKALKEAILNRDFLTSPTKVERLVLILTKSVETDLDPKSLTALSRKLIAATKNIRSYVLAEDLLLNPKPSPRYDNLYVFVPRSGNWDEVKSWVKTKIENR